MASGDTKTESYLRTAAEGTRADLPSDNCCNTKTQNLIVGVAERIMDVEDEVEELKNNPDVVDIVDTYQDLQNYDTSTLTDKDIIRVLQDSTHSGNSTYYRWNATTNQFNFVGEVAGGDVVKVLTSADYNYPVDNPTYIALGYLPDGFYTWGRDIRNNVYIGNTNMSPVTPAGRWAYVVTTNDGDSPTMKYIFSGSLGSSDASGDKTFDLYFFRKDNGNAGVYRHFLSSENIIDNLTSSDTVYPLSAKQGKVLKDLIDGMLITGAGAPTTSTTGTVGQLYEDTTNGKLYQCTAVSGSTYTWSEVGAGGGGGDTVYSDKTTSNSADGGAVYIGNLNASQEEQTDPTTTDYHFKYFWALPNLNSSTPGDRSINILGSNAGANWAIALGYGSSVIAGKDRGIAIGQSATVKGSGSIALGAQTYVDTSINNAVAIGRSSMPTRSGEVNIGAASSGNGYNSTNYRVLGGVHDPVDAHDAATKGYVDANAGGSLTYFTSVSPDSITSGVTLYSDSAHTTPISLATFFSALRNGKTVWLEYRNGEGEEDGRERDQIVSAFLTNVDTENAYNEVMPSATYYSSSGKRLLQPWELDPTATTNAFSIGQ